MNILGVIPARYESTRFPGKPLADICGKPMIWWVYQQAKKSKKLTAVCVATDDDRIQQVCESFAIPVVMTSKLHGTSTERLLEVADTIAADIYVCINGDEPLIDVAHIDAIIPTSSINNEIYVSNLMAEINDPVELIDPTNIKVVVDKQDYALFFSRSPIPYPKSSLDYKYYKHVGVLAYNRAALQFFSSTPKGGNEKVEDVNELRFVEGGVKLKMIRVKSSGSLSVDVPKDLDKVVSVVKARGLSEQSPSG